MTRRRGRPSTSAIYRYAERLRQEMLEEYRVLQEAEYAAAVHATHGKMLSRRGKDDGPGSWAVFTGNAPTLVAYASPELLEWIRLHPRTTRTAFERQWVEARYGCTA